ncbi:MAG: Zn-dependent protease-like protein [Pseudonocardiales bacterium]|nr:Zn-dependent protease-like protein [Pseudonocardiales bacterium]
MVPVGRFFGVPVYFAPSWLIIAALLTIYYGPIVRDAVPGVSDSTAYLVAFAYAVLFALCVVAHELGHTAVSLALGTPVRRVVIFLLGGVSEIERDPQRPRDEFLVAAAGPLVSIVLTGLAALGYQFIDHATILGVLLALLLWSNLVVAVFNLLPGLPLDGGRLLRAAVWTIARSRLTGTRAAAWTGRAVAVAVAVSGLVADRTSWGYTAGLLSIALAAYLWFGAGQSLRAGELLERLPALNLLELLRPGLFVPPDLSVAEALRRAWSGNARGLVLVDSAARPQAIVDEVMIGSVPPERRPWTSLVEVARPLEPGLVLTLGLSGEDLLAAVRATPAHEYLVVNEDGSPAGILAVTDLAATLSGST